MFGWLNRKPSTPSLRDVLFGDLPISQWPGDSRPVEGEPWASFVEARQLLGAGRTSDGVQVLERILAMPDLESRHYLQAWHFLRGAGVSPDASVAKTVYGVVVEVAMEQGHDVLAAYRDRTARYINFSGAAIVWERADGSLDEQIGAVLAAGEEVAKHIGPWDGKKLPAPPEGWARISMLTPSGLHFGQGPFGALAADGMGGPVIALATRLMQSLMAKTEKK